jgi:hypothetical protein
MSVVGGDGPPCGQNAYTYGAPRRKVCFVVRSGRSMSKSAVFPNVFAWVRSKCLVLCEL